MDWAMIIEVTLPALLTLGGVYLGSWMTFRINEANRKCEVEEREKERQERRREAKTELAVELTKNDVKIIDESIDRDIRGLDIVAEIWRRKKTGELSETEFVAELQTLLSKDSELTKLSELDTICRKLVYAMGEEFSAEYTRFTDAWVQYTDCIAGLPPKEGGCPNAEELAERFLRLAGELHGMLVQKVVSIRDG